MFKWEERTEEDDSYGIIADRARTYYDLGKVFLIFSHISLWSSIAVFFLTFFVTPHYTVLGIELGMILVVLLLMLVMSVIITYLFNYRLAELEPLLEEYDE